MTSRTQERAEVYRGPTAQLLFRVDPESLPWIYSTLMNEPVDLLKGEFPEPFTDLHIQARASQNQAVMVAALGAGPDFNDRYGQTIGTPADLEPLIKRYPGSTFDEDGDLVVKKDDQVFALIMRAKRNGDKIVIQKGGQFGAMELSSDSPSNDLGVHLEQFNLLVQRYVSAIWKASPETEQRQMRMVLSIPDASETATKTYLSTFELMARQYSVRPREIDLGTDIGGYSRTKALARALILDATDPNVSRGFGTQPFANKFILVTGREGAGKSLFPKAMYSMMRAKFGDTLEYFRLPLDTIFDQHGPHSVIVVRTILDHLKANEKNGVPTFAHLDRLHELVPPHHRVNGMVHAVPLSEFNLSLQTRNPVVIALRQFGAELGGDSHHVILYGESRIPREHLPEGVQSTFRRAFNLDPNSDDLREILATQMRFTRAQAERAGIDPFSPAFESELADIAQRAVGLVGRDIQQAIINIADLHKAQWDGTNYPSITPREMIDELNRIALDRGIDPDKKQRGPLGFGAFKRN